MAIGLLAGCGEATGSFIAATARSTRSLEPVQTPTSIVTATEAAAPSLEDESPYGLFAISRAAVIGTLNAKFPTMACDDERIWDSLEPAVDGTPWTYLACSITPESVFQFISDPEGRLRSASAASIDADDNDVPMFAALVSAVAGSIGEAQFPKLLAALEAGEGTVEADGGYRFRATADLSTWTIDVTPVR